MAAEEESMLTEKIDESEEIEEKLCEGELPEKRKCKVCGEMGTRCLRAQLFVQL